MTASISLHPTPNAGFDEPFEMLLACHERVERMLGLLERLAAHLAKAGADEQARQAATDVLRYFDLAGPAHHEDEERHVFPALRALAEPSLDTLVDRLQREHVAMAQSWAGLRLSLRVVAGGELPAPRLDWQAFATLYRDHIAAEEFAAYPAARRVLDVAAQQAMGHEMARRRVAPKLTSVKA
jgi:hemerythrin-like domain-containing protein